MQYQTEPILLLAGLFIKTAVSGLRILSFSLELRIPKSEQLNDRDKQIVRLRSVKKPD
jgi:hypothetical protein